jgi:hypothetical protein
MKHITVSELESVASIVLEEVGPAMSRAERLQRWAELLEREPDRRLAALSGTEHEPVNIRAKMRTSCSPISVAFEDARLRVEGLADDSYGEAKRFFELTDWQLHSIVCHCHHGSRMPAAVAARCVRAAIDGSGWLAWFRSFAMR